MFERSAPPAPGGGLDRAWIARQSHQDLLFGKEDEEGRAGYNGPGGGGRRPRRRGHKEAEQMKLLDNIARGQYEMCEDFVGDVGADFISQLLQACPARRMSASRAAEHPWLGPLSKVPPRKRAARAEVAAISAERSADAAERSKARQQRQQRQQQQLLLRYHHHRQQEQKKRLQRRQRRRPH
ncbi:unnamed protein product [Laminaria digitata]